MKPHTLAVLGGTGFVGKHLVTRLVRDGHRIRIFSRNRNLQRELQVLPGVSIEDVDVYDADALASRLQGADAVINLVGILNERGDSGGGFDKVYVELTEALIAACHKAGVQRLLQMSALNAGRGRSNYLRARGEAEAEIKGSGLKWTLFQPSVIFGQGDGLFFRFAQLLAFMPVLPLARADAKFAPVYVGDVAEAFARTLLDDASIGQTYELYGPQVMTLAEIVRYTAKQRGIYRLVLPLPDALGRLQALASEFIPGKPFSRDNFRSLLTPSVGGIDGLYRLGIERTPVDAVMPALLRREGRQLPLDRYRRYAAR